MSDPTPRMTVGEIMKKWPYSSHVLKRHGVEDLLWWSGTPLGEVCTQLRLAVEPILRDVVAEGNEPPKARSALVVDPGSEVEALEAAAEERAEIEAELSSAEEEPLPAAPAPTAEALPDVAAMFRSRPLQPSPTGRPKRARSPSDAGPTGAPKPPPKPLTPEEQAAKEAAEAAARAKAEEEAKAAASLPDVAAMFRARPTAPPPPPPEEEAKAPPGQKGLEIPPKDSDSFLAQVMKWGQPPT